MLKNEISINNILQVNFKLPESKFSGRYTKTSMFMLYALDLDLRNRLFSQFFVNAFLGDAEYETDLTNCIYLLFKVKNLKNAEWVRLSEIIGNRPILKQTYVTDYYCGMNGDNHLIMYVFRIPDKYMNDYYHFRMGRYSKFSKEYKDKFPKETVDRVGKTVETEAYGAITKSKRLKNKWKEEFNLTDEFVDTLDELWEAPIKDRETYRFKIEET